MNILLYSIEGDGSALIPTLQREGHEVLLYIASESDRRIFDRMIWKTTEPDTIARQADLILFDSNGKGKKAASYREAGYRVWNGGVINDKLEYDRVYGMSVFKECGIQIPDTFEVSTVDEVAAVLKSEFKKTEKAVVKIDGKMAAGSSFSYCGKNPDDVVAQIKYWDEEGLLPPEWTGIIQRFVEGIEVSTEAWWNGESFSDHNCTFEEKKLLVGGLGPAIGCAYNTLFRIQPNSHLVKLLMDPLGPFLKANGYVGQIDVNAIVGKDDGVPYALEFTPRCGYDATPTLAFGDGEYGNLIFRALGMEGETPRVDAHMDGPFFAGVRVHIPPYPFIDSKNKHLEIEAYKEIDGVPIEIDTETFYPYDVRAADDGRLVCAGTGGTIGVAMGDGSDPRSAARAALRNAERACIPNKGYRTDGWERAQEQVPELISSKLVKLRA